MTPHRGGFLSCRHSACRFARFVGLPALVILVLVSVVLWAVLIAKAVLR